MENLDLSPFCKTKAQANEFIAALAKISERAYETEFSIEKVALDVLGIQKKDTFLQLLSQNNIATSPTALKEFLTKLQETVSKLPVLSLTIAFEPKESTLKVFSDWFFLNLKKQVLFDILVDYSIVGGAVINYNGKHVSFILKNIFDQVLHDFVMKEKTTPPPSPQSTQQHVENLHVGR